MAPHSSTLACEIPWTEEPGRLQSIGSWRVGHDWETSLSPFTFMHWRRQWQPTPVFLPRESQGRGSLVGCHLWGRTELHTLKQLRSSSMVDWSDHLEVSRVWHTWRSELDRHGPELYSFSSQLYKLEDVTLTSLFVINKRLIEPALHHYWHLTNVKNLSSCYSTI